MTFPAELLKRAQRLEYFICIEGLGWPSNDIYGALSGGFDGVVFTTNDIDSDLATKLGCTIKKGLRLPGSIGWSLDAKTATYDPGGLTFSINDRDDFLMGKLRARNGGTFDKLDAETTDRDTTLSTASGNFAEGAEVWVGGRELVVLTTKNGTDYESCVRGYLGTPKGGNLRQPDGVVAHTWPVDTGMTLFGGYLYNRKVILYGHVPGEASDYCAILWYGKLRGLENKDCACVFDFTCAGEVLSEANRIWKPLECTVVKDEVNVDGFIGPEYEGGVGSNSIINGMSFAERTIEFKSSGFTTGTQLGTTTEPDDRYGLCFAYQYRTEPGGTAGAKTAWDTVVSTNAPQAIDTATETDILRSHVLLDNGEIIELKKRTDSAFKIIVDPVSKIGYKKENAETPIRDSFLSETNGKKAKFLLDNWNNEYQFSRFSHGTLVSRNPIDIFLMFLLSQDKEIRIFDATNVGSSATVVESGGSNFAADEYNGYALFCVEGNNKGEARLILDTSTTGITVERGFTNSPTNSTEYQVRNSIYDVLPFGVGLGQDVKSIDLDSFENLKATIFCGVEVGRFFLGTEGQINVYEFLKQNILIPYGILLYVNPTNGKLTASYIGANFGDGKLETYYAISQSMIKTKGSLDYSLTEPVPKVTLKIRAMNKRVVETRTTNRGSYTYSGFSYEQIESMVAGTTADITNYVTVASDMETIQPSSGDEGLVISALLDTEETVTNFLHGRMVGLLGQYSIPPPVWRGQLGLECYLNLKPGQWVTLTWNNPAYPINPYATTRGWTALVGRVIECAIPLNKDATRIEVAIELFGAAPNYGLIAPAAKLTGATSGTPESYFAVGDGNYVADTDNDKDFYYFEVGDLIEWRDITGASKGGPYTIAYFGSNSSSTPEGAANSRIYVTGAIAPITYAAGDYVTFYKWYASTTTRMKKYSAYATSAGALTGGDAPRRYS